LKNLASYLGSKYSIATSNASSAFDIVISSLKFNKNDIAILSANTFCACANSLVKFKKNFLFCDIKQNEPNLDPIKLEKEIINQKRKGKKVKLVIVTDYAGIPADWKQFKNLKQKYKFILINDNCHALGSAYFGDKKYASKYSDIVIQSFHAVKNITTGEGGAIITNHKKFYEKFKILREHGFKKQNYWKYEIEEVGFNSRLSEMQCALGVSQLKKIDKFLIKRKNITNYYNNYFKKFNLIQTPIIEKNKISANHLYFLRINFKKLKIKKDIFIEELQKKKIFLQVHYTPTYRFKKYRSNFKRINFKNTENFFKETVSIPIYYELKKKDLKFICNQILNVLCKKYT